MILEAVQSVCSQTLLPKRIIIVDDGSTDKYSLEVLTSIKNNNELLVPVTIHFQKIVEYQQLEIPASIKHNHQWF